MFWLKLWRCDYSTRCVFWSVSVLQLRHTCDWVQIHLLWLSSNSSGRRVVSLIYVPSPIDEVLVSPQRFFSRHGGQEPHQEMVGRIPPEVYNSAASAKPLPWIRRSCRRRSWDCGTRMSPGWPTAKRWAWMSWWIKDEFGQWSISSGKQKHLLNMAIETVDFPIKSGDVP